MKTFIKVLAVLSIVCASFVIHKAQISTDEFLSINGKFGIKLPQGYTDYRPSVLLKVAGQNFDLSMIKWQTQAGLFSVAYGDGTFDLEAKSETFFSDFRNMYLPRFNVSSALRDVKKNLDGHPGLELVIETQNTRLITRIFLVKNRLYFLTLALNSEQRKLEESGDKTLSTFRLLKSEEIAAGREEIAKSIEIESLPQEPSGSKAKTDVEDKNLKGKIKQVLSEEDWFFGENLFGNRTPVSVEEFNERGYLVKKTGYYDGLPDSVTVYGYLNGERAAKQALRGIRRDVVQDESGSSRAMNKQEISKQSYKLKYKYDSAGRLEEETTIYQIIGDKKQRVAYKYKDRKIEATFFEESSDDTHTKVISVLDEKGNPIEEIYDVSSLSSLGTFSMFTSWVNSNEILRDLASVANSVGSVKVKDTKYTYAYEFDSQGNWTKRITSIVVKKDGKTVSVPIKVTYRTITYY